MTQSIEPDFDITKYHKCLSDLYWFGCYEGDAHFKQYFEPSTYAHPAKISPLLADRIFKHLEKLELLKEGMTILDFMVGSGRIPLMASLRGYKGLGVELEPHFVKMCNDNKKFAENKIGRKLDMDIIQGDSRQLSKLLSKSDVAVVSPPFTDQNQGTKPLSERNDGMALRLRKERPNTYDKTGVGSSSKEYSDNPSNIGNLPYKQMVGVVSPPYHDSMSSEKHGIDTTKLQDGIKNPRTKYLNNLEYSQNPENIGNLKDTSFVGITSKSNRNIYIPINIILPLCQIKNLTNVQIAENYAGQKDVGIVGKEIQISLKELKSIIEKYLKPTKENQNLGYKVQSITIGKVEIQDGVEEGGNQSINKQKNEIIILAKNVGEQEMRLKYVFTISKDGKMEEQQFLKILLQSVNHATIKNINLVIKDLFITARYVEGNIILVQLCREYVKNQNAEQHTTQQNIIDGSQRNEQPNYLSEMLRVYKEASKVCPIICTVTKNPTRAGKLRRLDLDTKKLLELAGYTIIDYHRAVLFKTYEQSTLTGETKKEHKGRLSFFKRLSLQKGNQAAMFEDVLIGVRNG